MYTKNILSLDERTSPELSLARVFYNLSLCYKCLQQYPKAFEHLNEYYTLNVQANNMLGKFKGVYEIADLHLTTNNLTKAAELLENLARAIKEVPVILFPPLEFFFLVKRYLNNFCY